MLKDNPFVLMAHAARTSSEDPLQKFKFRVTIPGIPSKIGFQKVTGLSKEINVVEYDESAFEYTHKLPGKTSFGEVTMERGMFADSSMLDQMKVITNPDFRTTMIIQLCDRFGNAKRTWKLAEAWISKWEGSDLDSTSDDVAIETITVQYEYLL
jgi:phage tail-like protein